MSFLNDHPEYKTYGSNGFYLTSMPSGVASALEGFITRYAGTSGTLKEICHDLSKYIPCELTTNWGWDFLISDLSVLLSRISKSDFHKYMDFLSSFAEQYLDTNGIKELNQILKDNKVGYYLEYDEYTKTCYWVISTEIEYNSSGILETEEEAKNCCTIAVEHLSQARKNIECANSERARKDAVRDCMSAMEILLKSITNENDINEATRSLRTQPSWGPNVIIKDGLSIWNHLHRLYPDIRHGSIPNIPLSHFEAAYWIHRINTYMSYIIRKYKELNL